MKSQKIIDYSQAHSFHVLSGLCGAWLCGFSDMVTSHFVIFRHISHSQRSQPINLLKNGRFSGRLLAMWVQLCGLVGHLWARVLQYLCLPIYVIYVSNVRKVCMCMHTYLCNLCNMCICVAMHVSVSTNVALPSTEEMKNSDARPLDAHNAVCSVPFAAVRSQPKVEALFVNTQQHWLCTAERTHLHSTPHSSLSTLRERAFKVYLFLHIQSQYMCLPRWGR